MSTGAKLFLGAAGAAAVLFAGYELLGPAPDGPSPAVAAADESAAPSLPEATAAPAVATPNTAPERAAVAPAEHDSRENEALAAARAPGSFGQYGSSG